MLKNLWKLLVKKLKKKAEFPNDKITSLRYDLIKEELEELKEAIEKKILKRLLMHLQIFYM